MMLEQSIKFFVMKKYLYRFSNGHEIEREPTQETMDEIEQYLFTEGCELVYNGFRDHLDGISLLRANSHSKGDGFKPGWNTALGMEITSHGQYQEILKQRGLTEIGNEKRADPKKETKVFTEDIIKTANENGAGISHDDAMKVINSPI